MLHDPLRDRGFECKTSDEPTAIIDVVPSVDSRGQRLPDKFDAFLSDERIARAATAPFCCAARVLIERGWPPDTILVMRHRCSTTESFRTPINVAAQLTVREDRCGPRFDRWRPMPLRAVDAPIAQPGTAATPQGMPSKFSDAARAAERLSADGSDRRFPPSRQFRPAARCVNYGGSRSGRAPAVGSSVIAVDERPQRPSGSRLASAT
jgi:hypothetical protein